MLLRKGVKNANLEALRDPQFCHFKVAPLRRTWVAPLGRSSTILSINLQFLGFGQTTIYGIIHNTTKGQIQAYLIFLNGQPEKELIAGYFLRAWIPFQC